MEKTEDGILENISIEETHEGDEKEDGDQEEEQLVTQPTWRKL